MRALAATLRRTVTCRAQNANLLSKIRKHAARLWVPTLIVFMAKGSGQDALGEVRVTGRLRGVLNGRKLVRLSF